MSGGGGAGGAGGKSSKKGKGKKNLKKTKGKKDPKGGKKAAKKGTCGSASEPIDVVTGRVFTLDSVDVALPGPLPFGFLRSYSSVANRRDVGLGYGWAHSLGWEVVVYGATVEVWDDEGTASVFDAVPIGDARIGEDGWVLRHEPWGYAVDADDGLWRIFSAPDKTNKRFRLTAVDDRHGNRIAITYDDGRLAEVVDCAGRQLRFRTTPEGRITSISMKTREAGGATVELASYVYDEHGNLVQATDGDGYSSRFAYDEEHRMTTHVNRVGLAWHYVYDGEGRGVEAWGDYPGRVDPSLIETGLPRTLADGLTRVKGVHHCRLSFMPDGYCEVATASNVIRYFGNEHGVVSKEVNGAGVESSVYDDNGHLIAYTDETAATTTYEVDPRGRVLKVTDPLGRTHQFKRDAAGLVVEWINEVGAITTIERDSRGRAVTVVRPNEGVTQYRYDDHGQITEIVLPTGGRVLATYDEQLNQTSVTLPNGMSYQWAYDHFGRRIAETKPNGQKNHYAYSNRGDLLSILTPTGITRVDWDGEQRIVCQTDPNGRTVETAFGGYDVPVEERDENGLSTLFRYDLEGQLLEVRNPMGEVWSFAYDGSGQCIHQKAFDGREYWFGYDLSGVVNKVEDSLGRVTRLTYDADQNLVGRLLADGTEEKYEYDERGNMLLATNGATTVRCRRDVMGQIVEETHETEDGASFSVQFQYDRNAQRVGRRTSLGHSDVLERDGIGWATRLWLGTVGAPLDVRFERSYDGTESARELGRGGRIESELDFESRVTRRRVVGSSAPAIVDTTPEFRGLRSLGTVLERTFAYDPAGGVLRTLGRRGASEYSYDGVGQLLEVIGSDGSTEASYRYDAAGNRTESGAAPCVYGPGNRILQRGTTYFEWDADGQMIGKRRVDPTGATSDRVWRYSWNAKSQLEAVETPDGARVEFTYDPFWRRVKKVVRYPTADSTLEVVEQVRFVWDGDQLAHEIRTWTNAEGKSVIDERTYCFDDETDLPIAHRDRRRENGEVTEGEWVHYVNDQAGAPEALVLADGSLVCEFAKTADGRATPLPGATASTQIRLQGQYADDETGLSYNKFRYYDPETATFISADPIGLEGGLNSYQFAPNALGWADPLGLAKKKSNSQVGQALEDHRRAQFQNPPWEIVDTACGRNGIDIMAVKKDSKGKIEAVRIEECKANSSKVATTKKGGKQMSQKWIKKNIARKRKRSKKQNCSTAQLDEAEKFMKDNPDKVEKAIITGKVDRTTLAVTDVQQQSVSTQGNKQVQGPKSPATAMT